MSQDVTPAGRAGHYRVLDGLRGIAAIAVLAMHISYNLGLKHGMYHSFMAVPFFFILSGFVIGERYEKRLAAGETFFGFMRVRFRRLYPMIALGAVIFFITAAAFEPRAAVWTMLALFILPVLSGHIAFPANPPMWSLFIELTGNAAHALAFRLLRIPLLVTLSGGAVLSLLVGSMWTHRLAIPGNPLLSGALTFAATYPLGVAISRLRLPARIRWQPPAIFVLGALVVILIAPGPLVGTIAVLRDLISLAFFFPVIMLLGCNARTGVRSRWACDLLGRLSYPVYVLNYPLLEFAGRTAPTNTGLRYMLAPALLVFVTGFSWIVLKVYDEPVRAWLSKATRGLKKPQLSEAVERPWLQP